MSTDSSSADSRLEHKLRAYYITALAGVLFAVIGFSYNAWRMEVSEDNSNVRTAAFAVLTELAELEQLIYAAHYDQNPVEGNPRRGWVKVGLILDLSGLVSHSVESQAGQLKESWQRSWNSFAGNQQLTDELILAIEAVRAQIKLRLVQLQ